MSDQSVAHHGTDSLTNPGQTGWMLVGLGLATWMEFYTYDAVNLVLPDIAGSFGVSQDEASWFLTTYSSALLLGVPVSIWMPRQPPKRCFSGAPFSDFPAPG